MGVIGCSCSGSWLVAKVLMPACNPGGFIVAILLGVAGAPVGGDSVGRSAGTAWASRSAS